jgi:hypothetical protein
LKGNCNFLYEDFLSGLSDSIDNSHFESTIQVDLPVIIRPPFSIGGGASLKIFNKHLLHLSREWFSRIPKYTVLSANPFLGQSTGSRIGFTLYEEAEQVFNYGAGMEFRIRD